MLELDVVVVVGAGGRFCHGQKIWLDRTLKPRTLNSGYYEKPETHLSLAKQFIVLTLQVISGMWAKLAGARNRLQPGNCKININRTSQTHKAAKICKRHNKYVTHTHTHNHMIWDPTIFKMYLFSLFEVCQTHAVTDIWIGQETNCIGTLVIAQLACSCFGRDFFSFSQKYISI